MTKLDRLKPNAPKKPIVDWKRLLDKSKDTGLLSTALEDNLQALEDFRLDARPRTLEEFSSESELLSWCIQAPASELQQARDLVAQAHSSLDELMQDVDGLMAEASDDDDLTLEDLHSKGKTIEASCESILKTLNAEG